VFPFSIRLVAVSFFRARCSNPSDPLIRLIVFWFSSLMHTRQNDENRV